MSRRSPLVIELSEEDRRRLESVARKQTSERRMVVRAGIVLAVADGEEVVGELPPHVRRLPPRC